ncbi:MAG: DUF134 domain-containing protein [Candidatus Kryptoniota bacterium]
MSRPTSTRKICHPPLYSYFKPADKIVSGVEEIILSLDELEAIRLADHEGFYYEEAAEKMGVSRQTFGRIIESGRRKIADAIISGKAIRIEGGEIDLQGKGMYHCYDCHHSWRIPRNKEGCPHCRSLNIFYIEENGTATLQKFGERMKF